MAQYGQIFLEPVQENANGSSYDAHSVTNVIKETLEESSLEPEFESKTEP